MIWWFSFPEIYPVSELFSDFSGFFRIFLKFSDLTISLVIMDSLLLKFTIMTLFSKSCSGFRILPVLLDFLQIFKSSDFNSFHLAFRWFTSQIWYVDFPEKFQIFPDFLQIFRFNNFDHIFSKYLWYKFEIWYDNFLFLLNSFSVFSKYDIFSF